MQDLFSDPARLELGDVQVVKDPDKPSFEVWEGDLHLFDLTTGDEAILRAALIGYNAGKRDGAELGREEMRDALRGLLGVASSEFVESLNDRLRAGEL